MNKALPLALLLAVTSLPACIAHAQAAPAAASVEERSKALNDLFKEYWDANLAHSPEFASMIGDMRFNDKISDYSVQAANTWVAREQDFLMRLAAIDATGLSDQEKTSRELLQRELADDIEAAEFKEWEMPVSQMGGIYNDYARIVAALPFSTVKDYDDWIARLRALPKAFDQVTTNMAIGIEDKRVPPKFLLEKTLAQVQAMAAQKPEESPLALPLKQFPASISAAEQARIKTEMLDVLAKQVLPAYARFAHFMELSYVPAGRTEPGVWALPDGTKYYQNLLHRATSTALTADQIHQIGLDEVKRDEEEMLTIAQKLGFKDLATFRASLKDNPKLRPASGEALLEQFRNDLKPMQAKLPELFGRLPKAKFEVVPVPDYMAATQAPAYYENGTVDGSRPGRLFINTYHATERNLTVVETMAYHEGIPGHHLQVSLAQELDGLPAFRRYGNFTAYAEGWGLYAEHLGKDAGFFTDPYSDYGRLQGDIWRAIRLVVDTGVHSKHWTRQQMVDYFHAHSTIDEPSVQAEVDRYIAWPGQADAYKIGQLTLLGLRDKAQKELGAKFDIRRFHDEVLDSGALPLDMLIDCVEAWIASQK